MTEETVVPFDKMQMSRGACSIEFYQPPPLWQEALTAGAACSQQQLQLRLAWTQHSRGAQIWRDAASWVLTRGVKLYFP